MSERVTRRVVIRGRVQGVWYRDSMRQQAEAAGVTGWVRNRDDGSVEAVVHGPAAAVDRVIAWCRVGPPRALVEGVELSDAEGTFERFERR